MPTPGETFEEEKQGLIDLIIWYRDEYHRTQNGSHDELIQQVKDAQTSELLERVYRVVEDWVSY